jgi:hypothetical protein
METQPKETKTEKIEKLRQEHIDNLVINRNSISFETTKKFISLLYSLSSEREFIPIDNIFKDENGKDQLLKYKLDNKYSDSFFIKYGMYEISEDKSSVKWISKELMEDLTERLKKINSAIKKYPINPRTKKEDNKAIELAKTEPVDDTNIEENIPVEEEKENKPNTDHYGMMNHNVEVQESFRGNDYLELMARKMGCDPEEIEAIKNRVYEVKIRVNNNGVSNNTKEE